MTNASVSKFVIDVAEWAASQANILAVALVGSYANNTASDSSDVDLVLVVRQPLEYLQDRRWLDRFGIVKRERLEEYGKVKSIRVWYADGPEVEYGITGEFWLAQPLDAGTLRVIRNEMKVLFEREPILSRVKFKA